MEQKHIILPRIQQEFHQNPLSSGLRSLIEEYKVRIPTMSEAEKAHEDLVILDKLFAERPGISRSERHILLEVLVGEMKSHDYNYRLTLSNDREDQRLWDKVEKEGWVLSRAHKVSCLAFRCAKITGLPYPEMVGMVLEGLTTSKKPWCPEFERVMQEQAVRLMHTQGAAASVQQLKRKHMKKTHPKPPSTSPTPSTPFPGVRAAFEEWVTYLARSKPESTLHLIRREAQVEFEKMASRVRSLVARAEPLPDFSSLSNEGQEHEVRAACETLGIPSEGGRFDFTLAKKSYRSKARELHTDHGGDNSTMVRLNEAFTILKNWTELKGNTSC